MTLQLQQKSIQARLSDASIKDNHGAGFSAYIGNLDCYDDVIFPNAFKPAIESFLQNGFIPTDHNWSWDSMVAMPLLCEERGSQLYCEWEFHSTPDAQNIRAKAKERMERGLAVGLSIGFGFGDGDFKIFKGGEALLKYAEANSYDLSLFDTEAIKAFKGTIRGILRIPALYEFSIVAVPANNRATAQEIKSMPTPEPISATQAATPAPAVSAIVQETKAGEPQAEPAAVMPLVMVNGDRLELKSQYLGDSVEASMALSTLDELTCRLFYGVAGILYDWDGDHDSVDEKMANIAPMFEEFGRMAPAIIEAVMRAAELIDPESGDDAGEDMGDSPGAEMAVEIMSRWMNPEDATGILPGGSIHAGMTLARHRAATLAAVTRWIEREVQVQKCLRIQRKQALKSGRVMSQQTHDALSEMHDQMKEHHGEMGRQLQQMSDMLKDLDPDGYTDPEDSEGDGGDGGTCDEDKGAKASPASTLQALRLSALRHSSDLSLLSLRAGQGESAAVKAPGQAK